MVIMCVTGHRPDKLWGYNLQNENYIKLKNIFKDLLLKSQCKEAITGMALGVDTIFALAVLELKESGVDIKLHCAIPCLNHSSQWFGGSVEMYNEILSKADKVVIVNNGTYQPWMMQKRNEYMVDNSNTVIAVWDGSKGGTANCVRYAEKTGTTIVNIVPWKETKGRSIKIPNNTKEEDI